MLGGQLRSGDNGNTTRHIANNNDNERSKSNELTAIDRQVAVDKCALILLRNIETNVDRGIFFSFLNTV